MAADEKVRVEVAGFPRYEISADGIVFTCLVRRRVGGRRGGFEWVLGEQWRPLSQSVDKNGYRRVGLRRDGRLISQSVHRLVLRSFIGECPDGMVACHGNGTPSDNRLENLRWDTPRNNHYDKVLHGTFQQGSLAGNSKLTEQDVREIAGLIRGSSISLAGIARKFGVCRTVIRAIANGDTWRHVTGGAIERPKSNCKFRARLTPKEREAVNALRQRGHSARRLAAWFGISVAYARNINRFARKS